VTGASRHRGLSHRHGQWRADDLEPERRGFYAGAARYFGADGNMDTCIALRTALVKDGKMYVQAGGGVVADSDPETEYQEGRNKARAWLPIHFRPDHHTWVPKHPTSNTSIAR
jgi:isochorismate synthase EntC